MTLTTQDELHIIIKDPDPQLFKERLLKAISAVIRWRASYNEKYRNDEFNLYMISQLQEQLLNDG